MIPKKIGYWHGVALVTGNMIGSGIFLLPASLAAYGYFSLWGWVISATGAMLMAIVFSRLSRLLPGTGGPYHYTNSAFGHFFGFIVAWGYWICIWAGNAAIAVAFVSNLSPFIPLLKQEPLLGAFFSATTVWLLTLLNLSGIREAANFQVAATVLKIIPIVLIGSVGFIYFRKENFFVEPEHIEYPGIFLQTAALTLWSFLGIESATIPAEHIQNPEKNIPRATITGTVFSAIVFIASCTAVAGILPHEKAMISSAPFADAAGVMWGTAFYYIIAGSAALACLGALNGWILLQGMIPYAAAKDNLFPPFFKKENNNGVPVAAQITSSILITVLIFLNYSQSLQKQFQYLILLSTLSTLIPYCFCSVAELMMVVKKQRALITSGNEFRWMEHKKLIFLSVLALLFSVGAIAGSGKETILHGLVLLVLGIPLYLLSSRKRRISAKK